MQWIYIAFESDIGAISLLVCKSLCPCEVEIVLRDDMGRDCVSIGEPALAVLRKEYHTNLLKLTNKQRKTNP